MELSRRQATIGGATLLAGASMGTLAQAEGPLKRAVEDVEEQEKVSRAERLTPEELASRTIYRRAVDAVIWGLPVVGEDSVKQAAFRDGKANYNGNWLQRYRAYTISSRTPDALRHAV
jgi:hypothetical protein